MAVTVNDPKQLRLLTVDDWVEHPEADRYELIDGVLRARMVNQNYHEFAVGRVTYVLNAYLLRTGEVGTVFSSNTKYRVRVRRGIMPDVSVILGEKVRQIIPEAVYISVGPDLAVEVLSPDQDEAYIDERLDDYWKLGATEVWIVEPSSRRVTGFSRGASGYVSFSEAREDEELRSRLLPGLQFSVKLLWMG